MWTDREEPAHPREPATWAQTLQDTLSGLAICVVVFAVFAVTL